MLTATLNIPRALTRTLKLALFIGVGTGCLGAGLAAPAASFAQPPVNMQPPTITGTAQQGQTLTEVHGSWTMFPMRYAYQWLRCNSSGSSCVSISGANGETYAPLVADVGHKLRVQETASNFDGSGSPAESVATAVVVPPVPDNTAPPTITGSPQQGQTLTEAHGSWTNAPTGYSYQWQRCDSSGAGCASISGANAQTYTLVAEDVGHKLRLEETAGNAGGSSGAAASVPTAVVSAPPQGSSLQPSNPRPTPLVITIRSTTLNRHGVAVIPLLCPASATSGCRGNVTVTIVQPHARRASAARCARGCRPLGTTNYEARAGQKVGVRVHIASFGRRLLSKHSSVRVTLTATSVAGGHTATVTRAVTMRSAART